MSILFRCVCGRQLNAPDSGLIRRIKCPGCGAMATVPLGDSGEEVLDDGPQRVVLDSKTGEELRAEKARAQAPEQVPCDFVVDYGQYVRCYPLQPVLYAVLTVGFLAIALLSGILLLWVFVLVVGLFNVLCWVRATALGKLGVVCPGQVIDTRPYRVAIYANLSRADGYWPVLKVIEQPLGRLPGDKPKVGDLLPMAVTFQPDTDTDEHWADVDALAIPCLTRDAAAIQHHLDAVPKPQWVLLKSSLAKKKKLSNKLYKLNSPGAGWQTKRKDDAEADDED